MNMSGRLCKIGLILISMLPPLLAQGQMDSLLRREKGWSQAFQRFGSPFSYSDWERYESVRDSLKNTLVDLLAADPHMSYTFDTLDQHMAVLQSPDNRLRVCSWDEQSGGSMHDMAALAQFQDASGRLHYAWLDPEMIGMEAEDGDIETDVLYNRLYQLNSPGQPTAYLLIGWGTYGSGHHHCSARLLQIQGNRLVDVPHAFSGQKLLEVQAPRSMNVDMSFNAESQVLLHREFLHNPESGFTESTGRWVAWRFQNGVFQKQ